MMRQISNWMIRRFGVVLLVVGTMVTMALGYAGFSLLPSVNGSIPSVWDRIYLTFQLFVAESGYVAMPVSWQLEVARFLAPLVTAYAAVGALMLVFYEQYRLIWARLTYRNHIVICGLGKIGSLLLQPLQESSKRVIIIESNSENENIGLARDRGAVVLIGNPADPAVLQRARVALAERVIAVCETDGLNSDIAYQVGRLARPGRMLKCYAHIMNRYLCHFLMGQAITTQTNECFQLEFFNIYDSGARLLLSRNTYGRETLEGRSPHLVIIGLGPLGESLVVRSERLWRPFTAGEGKKLQFTLLDSHAAERMAMLKLEYPFLAETCEMLAYDLDVRSPGFLENWPPFERNELKDIGKYYVCLEDDTTALTVAFLLQQRSRAFGIPIVVALDQYDGLAKSIGWQREGEAGGDLSDELDLAVFGLLEQTCWTEALNEGIYEDLAIAIHQAFCAGEMARGRNPEDPALAAWYPQTGLAGLSEKYKEDNRRQARSIGRRLWSQGYGIEPLDCVKNSCFKFDNDTPVLCKENDRMETELETLARQEHEVWMKERIIQGWKPGTERNNDRKIHDLLFDWYDPRLKEAAREKTRQIIQNWPHLLAQVDLQIYRRKCRTV